ncbi:hypothetical protein U1Q18_018643 [Sarracenia purpurea var. burkii]
MLSPTPLSLFCTLLICLPFALLLTIISPPTDTTANGSTIPIITTTTNTTTIPTLFSITPNISRINPVTTFTPKNTNNIPEKINNKTTASPPLPPPSTEKEVDDQILLHRASQVNPNPSPTYGKLAFMFLTTTPLPFAPLWELFFNQTPANLYNIYIHADPRYNYDPPFSGVFGNRVIPSSKPTRRHSATLISAARRLLSHALLHDPSNSMFALLSPSCVPLHSFEFTYKTLVGSNKSFIEILKNETGAYDRWAARGEHAMLPELPFPDFRIGSQFFVLTRKHARVVVSDTRLWSKFKLPCLEKSTCYPEEQYFPTLVSMEDPRGYVPATLTHVDWRGGCDGHPRTYRGSEVGPNLILSFRRDRPRYGDESDDGIDGSDSSVTNRRDPFLFARKFSLDSIQPLLRIASDVILKD